MFTAEKGYGFLKPDDGEPDVFFHISAVVQGGAEIAKGDNVEFDLGVDPRSGRSRASRVARLV